MTEGVSGGIDSDPNITFVILGYIEEKVVMVLSSESMEKAQQLAELAIWEDAELEACQIIGVRKDTLNQTKTVH